MSESPPDDEDEELELLLEPLDPEPDDFDALFPPPPSSSSFFSRVTLDGLAAPSPSSNIAACPIFVSIAALPPSVNVRFLVAFT